MGFQCLFRRMLFFAPKSLNPQDGILRTPIAFFLDSQLLVPERRKKRVPLLDGIETKTLGVIQLRTVGIFSKDRLDPPFEIGGRFLRAAAKVDVIFDLQAADIVVKL